MEFLLLAVTFGAMYFLIIRPQQKKSKEITALRDSLSVGDHVTTVGGIEGKIVELGEASFTLQTAGTTLITFNKLAIAKRSEADESAPIIQDDTVIYDEEQENNDEEN